MIISIGLIGISGRMGQVLCDLIAKDKNFKLIGGIRKKNQKNSKKDFLLLSKKVDIIIDFSSAKNLSNILAAAEKYSTPLIIGTTGYSKKQLDQIKNSSKKIAILLSFNFSFGIALCNIFLKTIAKNIENKFDIKIEETHHKTKKDKPSGTALMLKESLLKKSLSKKELCSNISNNDISIFSYRKDTTVGKHSIYFSNDNEKIQIHHEALDRKIFAKGALLCAKFLHTKKNGLYAVEDIFKI